MANEFIIRKGYKSLASSEITGSLSVSGSNISLVGADTPFLNIKDTTNGLTGKIRVANSYVYIEADQGNTVGSTRLVFKTDGTQFLYGDSNQNVFIPTGDVGIGTTTASHMLTVRGAVSASAYYGDGSNLSGISVSTPTLDQVTDQGATTTNNITVGNVTLNSRLTFDYGGDHYFEAGTNTIAYKSSGGSSIMLLNASTSAATFAGNVILENASSPKIDIKDTTNNVLLSIYSQDSNSIIGTYSNHPLKLFSNSSEAVEFDTSQNATFAGNVTVAGTLTAQEFHTEFVSASIIYESGSTKFGDTSDDIHSFTGSINILSGSATIKGPGAGLTIYNSTNGGGSLIRFTDQSTGTQIGDMTFFHSDGASQGGGASWHFVSEPDTVLVVGSSSVNGRFVAKSAGSTGEVDYGFYDDVNTGMVRTSADNVSLVAGGVRGVGVGNTAVTLKYAGSTKIATTNTGVTVTGDIDADDITIDDWGSVSASLATIVGNDLDGSGQADRVAIWSDADTVTFDSGFRYSADSLKLYNADYSAIDIQSDVAEHSSILFSSGSASSGRIGWHKQGYFASSAMSVNPNNAMFIQGNHGFDFTHNNTGSLSIKSGSADVIIDEKVNVGIGAATPVYKLDVRGDIGTDRYIRHTGDSNTYFGFSGSDTIQFNTAGNERLRIDSSGNVIVKSGLLYLGEADTSSGHINAYELMTFNIDTDNDDTNRYFAWYTNGAAGAGTELMRLTEDGRLGIGYDAPYDLVHIHNSTNSGTPDAQMNFTTGVTGAADGNGFRIGWNGSVANLYLFENADMRFATNNNEKMRIKADGKVGIGTDNPAQLLDVRGSNTVLRLQSSTSYVDMIMKSSGNTGFVNLDNSKMNFYVGGGSGGDLKMSILNTGNVGIGTTNVTRINATSTFFQPDENGKFLVMNHNSGSFIMLETNATGGGDQVGGIYFNKVGNQTDAHIHVAGIDAVIASHSTNGLSGGELRFFTKVAGAGDTSHHMLLDPSGNFGIGQDIDPVYKLHVNASSANEIARFESTDNDALISIKDNTDTVYIGLDASADIMSLGFDNQMSGTNLSIDTAGKVGIGTTSPDYSLDIAGNIGINDYMYHNGDSNTRIGFSGNDSFIVRTAGTDRITVNSSGNVGIGTTSPAEKLHIQGSVNGNIKALIENTNTGTSAYATLGFQSDENHSVQPAIFLNGANNTNYAGASSLNMYQHGNFPLGFVTSNTIRMTVTGAGDVGIGTTSPSNKLDVAGGAEFNAETYIRAQSNVGLRIQTIDQGLTGNDGLRVGLNATHAFVWNYENSPLSFGTNGSQKATILANGNVGIGTTSPSNKLDVMGAVSASTYYGDGSNLTGITAGGGNADTLDNIDSSQFLRSDANDDFSGTLNYTPDTGTILSVDGQAILQRMTANGAITIGHDDAVIIAGGDTSTVLNSNITNSNETVYIGAEGGLVVYGFPNNDTTWSNRQQFTFANDGKIKFGTGSDTNLYRSAANTLKTDDAFHATGLIQTNGYFQVVSSAQLLRKFVSSWSNADTHDVLYNGWSTNTGDYTYVKAAGNSTGGHGVAFIGDNVFAVGTTDVETGAMSDSATDPITNTYFRVNSSGGTFQKEGGAPQLTLHHGGSNAGTNDMLGQINFTADYSNSPIPYARIDVDTNSSGVRADMDFVVKSTSGNMETALKLQGGAAKPKSFFYNDMNVDGQIQMYDSATELVISGNTSGNAIFDNNTGTIAFQADGSTVNSLTIASNLITLNENVTATGNMTVAGTLTAQEFHTEFISASIIYESGSTKFGDTSDDNHDFTGSVNIDGTLTATVKSFDIEHPTQEGKRLIYGVLEGPEHAVYVRGESKADTVILPEEWVGLVDETSITAQFTPIGKPDIYYYEGYENNTVKVGGPEEKNYFYYIQATRKDVEPLITVQ